jgi:two-component system osmolarity sensor histidine kinase EnvZ
MFTPRPAGWSWQQPAQWLLRVGILGFSIAFVSLHGASRLARPIDAFASAARRFGTDPNARPMAEQGPTEMRRAIGAFNAMQAQNAAFCRRAGGDVLGDFARSSHAADADAAAGRVHR